MLRNMFSDVEGTAPMRCHRLGIVDVRSAVVMANLKGMLRASEKVTREPMKEYFSIYMSIARSALPSDVCSSMCCTSGERGDSSLVTKLACGQVTTRAVDEPGTWVAAVPGNDSTERGTQECHTA